jgi:chemotaxis protein MotB
MSADPKHQPAQGAAAAAQAEADAHAAGGAHGGGGHGKHKSHEADHGPGTPPWLISFGDMMTLFLCFFIMLVTMAKTQDAGLIASGLGPFVAQLGSTGLGGAMEGDNALEYTNEYRRRFGLQPITAEERDTGVQASASPSELEKLVRESLRPYSALGQPMVATFEQGSAELGPAGKRYLDLLADTLRPGREQVLVLEGHAGDAGEPFGYDNTRLAAMRALAVQDYLVKEHGFVAVRVEARTPAHEERSAEMPRNVDARLVQPMEKPQS